MVERSELIEKIEETIVYFMQQKADSFSKRSGVYSRYQGKVDAEINLREISNLISIARSKEVLENLNQIKQENIKKLNNLRESEKTLQERLELPVVLNYSENQISVLLPLNADEKDKLGLQSRLYKTLNVVAGEPKESLSYCNLSVIKTTKRRKNKLKKEIKTLPLEKDFKEANVTLKIEELNLLLDLSKIGTAETRIRPVETEELEKVYKIKDLAEKLGLKYRAAYDVVKKYSKKKKIKRKKPKTGKIGHFEFTQRVFDSIVADYESKKRKKSKVEVREKPYGIKDLASRLNMTPNGAIQFIKRNLIQLGIETPGSGSPYKFSKSQFDSLVAYHQFGGKLEKPKYLTKDVAKALNLSRGGAAHNLKKYFERKGIKAPGRSGTYKLTESQFNDLISSYKSRMKHTKLEERKEERLYTTKEVAENLGIAKLSAVGRVRRYCDRHNIKHKKRSHYRLTEKQFEEITAKRETVLPKVYRNEIIEMVKERRSDEFIIAHIARKYDVKNKGVIQGTVNIYKTRFSRGQS